MRKPTGQSRYYVHWHNAEGKLLKTSTGHKDKADAKRFLYSFDPDQYEASRIKSSNKDTNSHTTDATPGTTSLPKKNTRKTIGVVFDQFIADKSGTENGNKEKKDKTIKGYLVAFSRFSAYYLERQQEENKVRKENGERDHDIVRLRDEPIEMLNEHPQVDQASSDALRDMFEQFFDTKSEASARKYRSALSAFYTYLVKKRFVRLHLFRYKEGSDAYIKSFSVKPQSHGWFNKEELEQLCNNLDADYKMLRADGKPVCRYTYLSHQLLTDVFMFSVYVGTRQNELIHLKWTDIDWKHKQVTIKRDSFTDWDTKTKLFRTVPLNNIPYQILQRRFVELEAFKENHPDRVNDVLPYVFTSHKYKEMLKEHALSIKTGNLCKAIWGKSTNKTYHSFRHSFATYLAMQNVHITVIAKLMGHESTKTTEGYIHVPTTAVADAVANM
jgi:integrase